MSNTAEERADFSEHLPNKKTKKVLHETDERINLTPCEDIDDMIEKLEMERSHATTK